MNGAGAIEGVIVHHDAYYACDWKKLVSDAKPTEADISAEDSDTKWPLSTITKPELDDPVFDKDNIPTNMGSAFAITGETYRAIEAAGDTSSVLKYFRPLIIYWTGASDMEDVTRIFDSKTGYKISSFASPMPGYPYYNLTFDLFGDPNSTNTYSSRDVEDYIFEPQLLTARAYIPDPGEFYSQPDLKEDSAAPIPFIELPSLESIEFMTDSGSDFPTILEKAIAETGESMATEESIDDLTVIYAGISHVVPLPNLNQDFLNQLPKKIRDSWSLSRNNPFIRLSILKNLVMVTAAGDENPGLFPVNEIYGGGKDDSGSYIENPYNDDLLVEIKSLSDLIDSLVEKGVLASLDIYSY